jgi:hypothetical protein
MLQSCDSVIVQLQEFVFYSRAAADSEYRTLTFLLGKPELWREEGVVHCWKATVSYFIAVFADSTN